MIITVTFNPAIDKTAEVEELIVGGLNRLKNVLMDAGGKGVNVSKTIQALHGSSICTGFLAGSAGTFIAETLAQLQIDSDFVWVSGSTRTNLKVLNKDMELTELNEAGPMIQEAQLEALMQKVLSHTNKDTLVVLSGNVSPGVKNTVYKDMIERIHEAGGKVLLDADGDLFKEGIQARPDIIKPNKYELASYFHVGQDVSNQEIIRLAKTLLNEDTKLVVVSMGKEGSIFITKDATFQAEALSIEAHSAVGAGDAMVGAIALAIDQQYDLHRLMSLAVAASAGAVMTKGTKPADYETVEKLKRKVMIHTWEEK